MLSTREQLIQRLAPLDMGLGDDSNSLVFTAELLNTYSNISFYERILLERAQRIGVDAVYFKKYAEVNRAPVAQVYIFDFLDKSDYDLAEIHKAVWSSTDVRIYFVVTKTEIKIFNSSKPVIIDDSGNYSINPYDVLKLAGEAKRKYDLYSAKRFDTGEFWHDHKNEFGYNNTAYERLITELKNARKAFLNDIKLEAPIANKLLVLSILIKYLEERVDIDADGIETRVFEKGFFGKQIFGNSYNLVEVIRNGFQKNNEYIINLFSFLGSHFHGEIFTLPSEYIEKIKSVNLNPLANFLSGEFHNKQYVLWRLYSFNHLPIELISSIYEEFLEADKNKANGVAYTPAYLVNLLVDECMPLNEPKTDFRVLDPACGSGIFLVSVFKRLVDWWRVSVYEQNSKWVKPSSKELPALKELLLRNIFGLDIASEAVNLAIFSLSLTLCDMLSPTVIWEELKFDNLSDNIVNQDFFDWIDVKRSLKFDLIIGNPPFIEYNDSSVEINKLLLKREVALTIPNNQSALLFAVLSSSMLKHEKGILCFIMPAGPLLYNNSPLAVAFRKKFFSQYNIPQIIDFTFLSNSLFKNKGNEKNVAVAALFIQNKSFTIDKIFHIVAKKLKTISQRHYFEFDHYDFHVVRRDDAIHSKLVWKANLLGGGRLHQLIERISLLPTLKTYLLSKKEGGWDFGDGFIKGKDDSLIKEADIGKGKGQYSVAEHLTGTLTFEPRDFSEKGIARTSILQSKYYQWPRTPEIFKAPLLLIKKNLGDKSIPVFFSKQDISYKNEVIGIHCPPSDTEELFALYNRIKNNELYRFYIIATSARSGVSRSTKTTLQSDILGLPYSDRVEDTELSFIEKIVVNDTIDYWLDFLAKDIGIKMLQHASLDDLHAFAQVFCYALNTLFKRSNAGYRLVEVNTSYNSAYLIFTYNSDTTFSENIEQKEVDDTNIMHLLNGKMGANHRITRIVKYYEGDKIILLKPLEKRYWMQSIALRDADEVVKDLFDAGY